MFRNSDQTADNVYLNLSISNDTPNSTAPAVFSVTYDSPILDRPSDYYASVVKFEIPLETLPLLVFPLISEEQRTADLKAGFVTQVGTAISGINTKFNQLMIGGTLTHSAGTVTIVSVQNPTTMIVSAPFAVSNSTYTITYPIGPNNPFNLSDAIVGVCENNQPGSKAGAAPSYTPIPAYTQNLVYSPINQYMKPGDLRYPYVYSYEVLMQYANTALLGAWTAAGSPGGVGAAPFFSYDPETSFVNILMPQAFVDAGANGWTVCFNNNVQSIIPSYPIYLSNDPAFSNGRFEINTNQFAGLGAGGPGYDPFFYAPSSIFTNPTFIVTQDYQTVDYINSVRKIVLVSNSLPIRKQYYPPPNEANTGLTNTIPILADFQINLDNTAGAQRSIALYEAQIYRLIDMISDSPMARIDVQLFWSDQKNNLYPIYLGQNDSATIKLGFFSKNLYKDGIQKL